MQRYSNLLWASRQLMNRSVFSVIEHLTDLCFFIKGANISASTVCPLGPTSQPHHLCQYTAHLYHCSPFCLWFWDLHLSFGFLHVGSCRRGWLNSQRKRGDVWMPTEKKKNWIIITVPTTFIQRMNKHNVNNIHYNTQEYIWTKNVIKIITLWYISEQEMLFKNKQNATNRYKNKLRKCRLRKQVQMLR